jgi:signal transduction histidine kinase
MLLNAMSHVFNTVEPNEPAFAHLRQLWDITQDPQMGLRTKLELVFERESEQFGLPYGFVSRTDPTTDTQVIEAAKGDHDLLQQGGTVPLSQSYCRHTIQSGDGVFTVDDASSEGWSDDPAYQLFQLESYIGGTVEFDERVFGTICFAGSEPRAKPIDEGERMLIEMLATWLSKELKARGPGDPFEYQPREFEEIASIISHDLRNPLTVAQGHIEILNDTIQESLDQVESAHGRMQDIIENMLTLARVDEPVRDPSIVALCPCASDAWEMVATNGATLSLHRGGVRIEADEGRLQQLFENLFRNSVEHGVREESDGTEAVHVEVNATEDGFCVDDDGPGIPPSERRSVFDPGYSTDLNGTGFGLNIVRRIATAHGWNVSIATSPLGGARFEFTGVDVVDEYP